MAISWTLLVLVLGTFIALGFYKAKHKVPKRVNTHSNVVRLPIEEQTRILENVRSSCSTKHDFNSVQDAMAYLESRAK